MKIKRAFCYIGLGICYTIMLVLIVPFCLFGVFLNVTENLRDIIDCTSDDLTDDNIM